MMAIKTGAVQGFSPAVSGRLKSLHYIGPIVVVAAFVAGLAITLDGQGRGAPPIARVLTGKIERVTVHGKSLEGNLEGDSPDRAALVYLPPTYLTDQARRFPVVYLLHGYDVRDIFAPLLASLQESGDRLSTQFVSYDIADERNHVAYGHKWLPQLLVRKGISTAPEQYIQEAVQLWQAEYVTQTLPIHER